MNGIKRCISAFILWAVRSELSALRQEIQERENAVRMDTCRELQRIAIWATSVDARMETPENVQSRLDTLERLVLQGTTSSRNGNKITERMTFGNRIS